MVYKKDTKQEEKEDVKEPEKSEYITEVPKSDIIEEAKEKNKSAVSTDPNYKKAGLYCVFQNKR